MKKAALFISILAFSACATTDQLGWTHKNYDVAVLATPITLKPLTGRVTVDAVEQDAAKAANAQAVLVFKIDRVLQGEMPSVKAGGPSKVDQAQQAYRDKEYLKLLTMDFEDPDREIPKEWISVAVEDPAVSFGIEPGENLDESARQYRLYLKKEKNKERSFVFVRGEPKK